MTLDELKQLDPKDAANWPIAVQIVCSAILLALIVGAGYLYLWSGQMDELSAGQATEEQLKQGYLDRKKKAVNLDAYRQQLVEIQQAFGAMLKQLPNKAEMETLLTEINQAGVGRGLVPESFKPGSEVKTSEFIEQPIEIRVSGSYHDISAFVGEVAQLSRIVTLGNMVLTPGKDSSQLSLSAVIRTYRMLDEAEAQAMRQAEADAKKKRK